MYTKEEAEKKWCPMVRIIEFDVSAGLTLKTNRNKINNISTNCIASECMMWKRGKADEKGNNRGYCGLIKQ